MEEKRSSGRAKRQSKVLDEGFWDCSVCTYKNSPEAYKCEMCDVRKGTSTRKPRINPQLVAQQVAQQFAPPPKKERSHTERKKEKTEQTTSSKHKGLVSAALKSGGLQYLQASELKKILADAKEEEKRLQQQQSGESEQMGTSRKEKKRKKKIKGLHPESDPGKDLVKRKNKRKKCDETGQPSLNPHNRQEEGHSENHSRESKSVQLHTKSSSVKSSPQASEDQDSRASTSSSQASSSLSSVASSSSSLSLSVQVRSGALSPGGVSFGFSVASSEAFSLKSSPDSVTSGEAFSSSSPHGQCSGTGTEGRSEALSTSSSDVLKADTEISSSVTLTASSRSSRPSSTASSVSSQSSVGAVSKGSGHTQTAPPMSSEAPMELYGASPDATSNGSSDVVPEPSGQVSPCDTSSDHQSDNTLTEKSLAAEAPHETSLLKAPSNVSGLSSLAEQATTSHQTVPAANFQISPQNLSRNPGGFSLSDSSDDCALSEIISENIASLDKQITDTDSSGVKDELPPSAAAASKQSSRQTAEPSQVRTEDLNPLMLTPPSTQLRRGRCKHKRVNQVSGSCHSAGHQEKGDNWTKVRTEGSSLGSEMNSAVQASGSKRRKQTSTPKSSRKQQPDFGSQSESDDRRQNRQRKKQGVGKRRKPGSEAESGGGDSSKRCRKEANVVRQVRNKAKLCVRTPKKQKGSSSCVDSSVSADSTATQRMAPDTQSKVLQKGCKQRQREQNCSQPEVNASEQSPVNRSLTATSARRSRSHSAGESQHNDAESSHSEERPRPSSRRPPRLKNVDRSKARHTAVTVGNVTVIVTDYQPKKDIRSSDSHNSSDASDTNSSTAPHDLHIDSPVRETHKD